MKEILKEMAGDFDKFIKAANEFVEKYEKKEESVKNHDPKKEYIKKDKITLKEFFNSDKLLCIHCDTEEKAKKLLKEFDKMGKTWENGISYLKQTYWGGDYLTTLYRNDNCVCFYQGCNDYADVTYEFEDIIFEEPKFSIGDTVKVLKTGEIGKIHHYFIDPNENYKITYSVKILDSEYGIGCSAYEMEKIEEPKFTEDEKVILRNLPEEFKWIARDKSGHLCIYYNKPCKNKDKDAWEDVKIFKNGDVENVYCLFSFYRNLFQSIKWEDEEPCEFRKYL